MEALKVFENPEFGKVRTIEIDEKLYFAGTDVASALGYAKPYNAVSIHCKGVTLKRGNDELGRPQKMAFIPEGDIYRLVARSQLPSAEKFESWVFDVILPSIILWQMR